MIHMGFIIILLFLLLLPRSCSGLDVVAPITHDALIGSTTLLPCSFNVDNPPINLQFLAILWYYREKELIRYDNKEKFSTPRMSIDERETRQGNASLTIHNMTSADQGTYKCVIIYSPSSKSKEIQLNILAIPLVTLLKKAVSKKEKNRLLCMVTDFYPKDIAVTWLRNGQNLDGTEFGELQTDADGTYRVNSSITISPTQIQDHPNITCQAKHVSLQEPVQDGFTVQYGVEPKLSLFSSHHDGEQIYVCEVKEFYPNSVDIAWLLDGKKVESPRKNKDGSFNAWEGFLIPGNQKKPEDISCVVEHETLYSPLIITQAVKDVKDSQASSVIAAILLTMFITLGVIAAVLWFLVYRKKYFQRFQQSPIHVHARRSGRAEEKVTLYSTATSCPEKVQVTWTVIENDGQIVKVPEDCAERDGESGHLMSGDYTVSTSHSLTEGLNHAITSLTFTPNSPKHCNMTVTCRFQCGKKNKKKQLTWSPEKEWVFRAPEGIRKMPEGIEIKPAEGQSETPCSSVMMGNIAVTPLVHGRQARLQCVIRGSFPGLEVKWFRRAAGEQEMYEVSSSDKYKIPPMDITQEADKTHVYIAALIISVSALTEEGSKFICRVMHSSLQKPLEKRTGKLTVTGQPVVRRIQQNGRYIVLEVGGFYTADLKVTWGRGENQHGPYYQIPQERIQNTTSGDGDSSYTLTSTCEAMEITGHFNPNNAYFKAVVEHGALKSPIDTVFLRSRGKYYKITENGKEQLESLR